MPRFFSSTALLLSTAALVFTSCRRPEIRAYLAPKDVLPPEQHSADDGHDHGPREQRPRPKLTWKLPAGWTEAAGSEVSLATFSVKSDAGEGSVTITPLPNLQGQEALVVNMYRQQAGLPPLDPSEITGMLTPVEVAGGAGQLLQINGTSDGKPVLVVTAIAHRDGQSWFYRIAGDEALVTAQKSAFLDFVKTVRIEPAEAAAASAAQEPKFKWAMPQGWTALAAGQMQVAKFSVPERDGAKAEVAVSVFPSDTGGTLANVNRWRMQIGLGDVDAAGLAEIVTPLDPSTPDAQLVALVGEKQSMLGAIVPRGGQWWFYKMSGDASAVNAEREAFIQFVKSQP